jgi:hypothetical protein
LDLEAQVVVGDEYAKARVRQADRQTGRLTQRPEQRQRARCFRVDRGRHGNNGAVIAWQKWKTAGSSDPNDAGGRVKASDRMRWMDGDGSWMEGEMTWSAPLVRGLGTAVFIRCIPYIDIYIPAALYTALAYTNVLLIL